jgi:hypothetical protein
LLLVLRSLYAAVRTRKRVFRRQEVISGFGCHGFGSRLFYLANELGMPNIRLERRYCILSARILKGLAFLTLAIAACGVSALAAPSGLNMIPTADVLEPGTVSIETESEGRGMAWGDECDRFMLMQLGMGHGVEIGMDTCTNADASWLNVKWQMGSGTKSTPGIAVGLQGVSEASKSQPYFACARSFGKARVHVGILGIEGRGRPMLGLDRCVNERLTLQVDYIAGRENSSAYGVNYALSGSLGLSLARRIGNSSDVGNGYIVNLAWSRGLK